jgi:hypothetical protein
MSTKTTKKEDKKRTQTPEALANSCLPLAPPFAGGEPYNGVWKYFPVDGNYPPKQPLPCPGFWSAIRHYPLSGGIVSQLGAQPGTGLSACSQGVGYRFDFTPNIPHVLIFNLTLNLGPVSLRPRGGSVSTFAALQIWGPNNRYDEHFKVNLISNTGVSLCVSLQMQPGVRHTLQFLVAQFVYNAGYQSYGEIIVNSASLEARYPYGVQAAEAPSLDVAAGKESPLALIDRDKQQKGQEISLEKAIEMGTAEIRG